MQTIRQYPAHPKASIVAPLVVLIVLLLFASPLWAQEAEPAEPPKPELDTQRIELKNGVLILDTAMLGDKDAVIADITEAIADWQAYEHEDAFDPDKTAQAWGAALSALMDIPMDDPKMVQAMESLHRGLAMYGGLHAEIIDRPTIYVVNRDTLMLYCKAGGTVPAITYKPDEGVLTLGLSAKVDESGSDPIEAFTIPVDGTWADKGLPALQLIMGMAIGRELPPGSDPEDAKTIEQMRIFWNKSLKTLSFLSMYGCVFELLDQEVRNVLGHEAWWLHSGLIDYLAMQAIRDAGDADFADEIERFWVGQGRDLGEDEADRPDPSVCLRYWTGHVGAMANKGPVMEDFNNRRRQRALIELRRMVETVGLKKVLAVSRLIAQSKPDNSQAVEAMIKEQTGYDIAARLDQYQPAPDAEGVYAHEIMAYRQARDEKDFAAALVHAFLATEVQVSGYAKVNPTLSRTLEAVILAAGNAELYCAMHETFCKLALADRLDTDRDTAHEYAAQCAILALRGGNPEFAYGIIKVQSEITWPAATGNARLARLAIEIVEANRLIDQAELEAAAKLIEQSARVRKETQGNERLKELLKQSIEQAMERLQTAREKADVDRP